jgi:spore coat protein CotH
LFRAAGVPAPRDNFARVELNGRDLGLFVLEEAVNKEFLAKYFSRTKGNLYEGSKADINEKLQKDSGDDSKEQKDVKALAAALKEPDAALRLKKISSLLDVDRFISFAATEVFTWHHNGYTMGEDNYRIYADPATNRMVFIPHGYEQLFGKPNGPLIPEWKGLVIKAIMDTPEGKAKYRERMSKLLATAFKLDAITARINQLVPVLKPVAGSGSTQAQTFDAALTQLRERVTQRAAFIGEELKKPSN